MLSPTLQYSHTRVDILVKRKKIKKSIMPDKLKLKHICPDCNLNKWVIDYKEGCASELTRTSICLFCQQAKEIEKVRKENQDLKKQIKDMFSAISELRMNNKNLNEEVVENGRDIYDIRTKLTGEANNNTGARTIKNITIVGTPREDPFREATGRRLATRKPKHQPQLETPTSNRFSLLSEVEEETVLIGDSTVRDQGKHFCARNQRKRQVQSYPGAKTSNIKEVVGTLNPKNSKAIIIVQASGNDLFQRRVNVGETEPVVKQLASTVKAVREKTVNGILVGLLPRPNTSHYALSKAIGINTRLESICKQNGVKFLNLWDEFIGNKKLYQGGGNQFSEQGKKVFGNLLNESVFKLLQDTNHRGSTPGSNSENQVATARTVEIINQENM